jgi:hypothetical protein
MIIPPEERPILRQAQGLESIPGHARACLCFRVKDPLPVDGDPLEIPLGLGATPDAPRLMKKSRGKASLHSECCRYRPRVQGCVTP